MRIKFLTLIFILAINICFAEDYSLDYFIQKSLVNSSDIKLSQIENENSNANYQKSFINLFPKASVSSSHSDFTNDPLNHSLGFNISKNLTADESSVFNFLDQKVYLQDRKLMHEKTVLDVTYKLINNYLDVLQQQNQVDINESNLKIAKMSFEIAKIRKANEEIDMLDYKQIEISYLNATITDEENKQNLNNLRRNFFSEYKLKDEGFDFQDIDIEIAEDLPKYSKSINIAVKENELEIDKRELLRQKIQLFPNVSLNYSYQISDFDSELKNIFDFDQDGDHSLSLAFSYNFTDVFTDKIDYAVTKRNMKKNKINLEDARREEVNYFIQLSETFKSDKKSYALYKQKFNLAAEKLSLAEEKYKFGMINILELEQIKSEKLNSELSLNSKYFELIKTQISINKLINKKFK